MCIGQHKEMLIPRLQSKHTYNLTADDQAQWDMWLSDLRVPYDPKCQTVEFPGKKLSQPASLSLVFTASWGSTRGKDRIGAG